MAPYLLICTLNGCETPRANDTDPVDWDGKSITRVPAGSLQASGAQNISSVVGLSTNGRR